MNLSIQAELKAAKLHLDRAIKVSIQSRQVQHLGKLGAARYEIFETLQLLPKEAEADAPTSLVS
jgi:hypothetical protein